MLSKETQQVFENIIKNKILKLSPIFTDDSMLDDFIKSCLDEIGCLYNGEDVAHIKLILIPFIEELNEEDADDEPAMTLQETVEELIDKIENVREVLEDDILGYVEDQVRKVYQLIDAGKFEEDDPNLTIFHTCLYILDLIDKAIEEYDTHFLKSE